MMQTNTKIGYIKSDSLYDIEYSYKWDDGVNSPSITQDDFTMVPSERVEALVLSLREKHGSSMCAINWHLIEKTHHEQTMEMIDSIIEGVDNKHQTLSLLSKLKQLKEHLTPE